MVRADLERLVPSHNKSSLAILFVLEQPDISSTTLLPLARLAVELEKLGAHLERLLLELLVGLCLDFLGQANDGLEIDIRFLLIGAILIL